MFSMDELSDKQRAMAKRWGKLITPIRPSKETVDLYEQNIISAGKNNSESIWSVLGCTPEIRSLAGKYGAKIICIDQNPDAFFAYKTLCKPSPDEIFTCSDWRILNYKDKFDIVLGDGSISMLPLEDHPIFLTNLHRMIKNGGYAVLRIFVVAPLILDSVKKIFEWYRNKNDDTPIRILRTYLYPLWLNENTMSLNNNDYQANLLEVYRDGYLTNEEYHELDITIIPGINTQYTKKEVFEQLVSRWFRIQKIDYPEDYPLANANPVYLLQKK